MSKRKRPPSTSSIVPSGRTAKIHRGTASQRNGSASLVQLQNAIARPKGVKQKTNGSSKERTVAIRPMKTSPAGLKGLFSLFEQMNLEGGATFVIAQHLDSEHDRKLRKILAGADEKTRAGSDVQVWEIYERMSKELTAKTSELTRLHQEMTTLLDNLQIPFFLLSDNLRIKQCSRAAQRLLNNNHPEKEPSLSNTILAEQVPDLRIKAHQAIASLHPMEQQFRDGEGRWQKLHMQPLKSTANAAPSLLLTICDIDAQKRTESRLCAAHKRERQFLDTVTGIQLLLNKDQCVSLINKRGCELLGYPEDHILRKNWFDTFVPEPQKIKAKAVFSTLMSGQTGRIEELEIPLLAGDGQEKLVRWHYAALADEAGNPAAVFASGHDVTELRRMEGALRESKLRLHTIMQIKRDDEFFVIDPAGTIVSWAPGTRLKEAYQPDEIVGKHFSSLYPLDDFVSGKPMRILRIAEQVGRYEEEGLRASKGGKFHRARSILTAIRDEKGTLQGFSNVTRYLD
jgi:PAS domain S-box-containing protein